MLFLEKAVDSEELMECIRGDPRETDLNCKTL